MKRVASLLLVLVATVMLTGICFAAEDSLEVLQAKAATIKPGADGDKEEQVRALMGEPKAIRTDEKIVGVGNVLKRRILEYGPNGEIMVIIDIPYGHVRAVK
jgi:hypothetical protein